MHRHVFAVLVALFALVPFRADAAADAERVRFLALALYHEARGGGEAGMVAVGWAILNRKASPDYPDKVVGVVTEGGEDPPCQFSWYCDGESDRPEEPEEWDLAQDVSRRLLSDDPPPDPTGGAIYFWRADREPPAWAVGTVEETAEIGGNAFFKPKG